MLYRAIISLIIFLCISLLSSWGVYQYFAYLQHPKTAAGTQFQELDAGTQFDEKTGVLYAPVWRICVTLPGRPTKSKELPGFYDIAHAGCYEAPGISYLAGPKLTTLSGGLRHAIPLTSRRHHTVAVESDHSKYQCREIVRALRGNEATGYPISLLGGRYPGYYSEGSCEDGLYYKVKTYIDDENQSDRIVPFYLIVKGKYELVNSKQTDEFFNSFRLLPRASGAKV